MIESGKRTILYGGSFNPLHIGHMRLAIETLAQFQPLIKNLVFLPSFSPPHKKTSTLLPYLLRARLIEAAIENLPGLECCLIEQDLPEPSFTFDTLTGFRDKTGLRELYFLLGSGDFQLLPTWKKGLCLPQVCALVVAPRGRFGKREFVAQCQAFWPGGRLAPELGLKTGIGEACAYVAPGLKPIYMEEVPHLEISSSRIRKLWLEGIGVDFLVPEKSLKILNEEAGVARDVWREKISRC